MGTGLKYVFFQNVGQMMRPIDRGCKDKTTCINASVQSATGAIFFILNYIRSNNTSFLYTSDTFVLYYTILAVPIQS